VGRNSGWEHGGRLALRDQVIRASIAALVAVNLYLAAVEPCTSAEAVVYERFASHSLLDLWKSPLDPRLGLVYGALARVATRLGGVSELTIRVPALLGGLLFWIGLAEFCRRLRGWTAVLVFLAVAANPWTFRFFSTATGTALAVGVLATAARFVENNRSAAGLLIGLAFGSDAVVAMPALAAAALAAAMLKANIWKCVDEFLLPGLLTGLFLLLPVLLIRQKPMYASANDFGTRSLVQLLRRQPRGPGSVPVAVSPSLEPGLVFYRRRFHLDWIQIVSAQKEAEFHLLAPGSGQPNLRVLESAPGAALTTN
jgi:hypothetical protein